MERVKEAGTPNVVGHGSGSGTREIDAASSHLKSPCRHDQTRGEAVREKAPRSSDSKTRGFFDGPTARVVLI
jgi:hypothetical protein